MSSDKKSLVVVTGGTGGHLFPAIALSEEMKIRDYKVYFFVDKKNNQVSLSKFVTCKILSSKLNKKNIFKFLFSIFVICIGIFQSIFLLFKYKPAAVIGFGGYVSFPSILAASFLSIPICIYEQNKIIGRTNKILTKRADLLLSAFKSINGLNQKQKHKFRHVGFVVRKDILNRRSREYSCPNSLEPINILIFGGSQGALSFSKFIPQAFSKLPLSFRKLLRIRQQCRREDIEMVKNFYIREEINAEVLGFIHDMDSHLTKSHLVISRAGASTVGELTTTGTPSILIPFPYATDNHQFENAEELRKHKACWVIEEKNLDSDELFNLLFYILSTPLDLKNFSNAARKYFQIGTLDLFADLINTVIEKRN